MTGSRDKTTLPPEPAEGNENSPDRDETATVPAGGRARGGGVKKTAAKPAARRRSKADVVAEAEKTPSEGAARGGHRKSAAKTTGTARGKDATVPEVTLGHKKVESAPRTAKTVPKDESAGRIAASRARAGGRKANRSDKRTAPRKKPAVKPVSAPPAQAAKPKPAAAPDTASAPVPPPAAAPPAAPMTTTTAAYLEAAFGPQSKVPEQLLGNIERIEGLTQRLLRVLSQPRTQNPAVEAPGPEFFTDTTAAWLRLMAEQPARIIGQQVSYWGETLRHVAQAQAALTRGTLIAPESGDAPPSSDRRFANPLWDRHPFFNFVRRQYEINAKALQQAADALQVEDDIQRQRIDWFTRQIIDMMAPTNFLATNPDALERAIATEGESLVRGLENLVRDVEAHGGQLVVSLADREAFRVGENIATTPGTVVARTPLYELIQYKPTTEKVHALPVVIFPPWINKFYIMDLKPKNSLIKWIVDQGFTLFVVAWKNPDAGHAGIGMDDYVSAYLDVTDRARELTGQDRLNAVGYCIAGTTLALTLALLKKRGDARANSATFFTTLTDFEDQGEFTAYLQDDFVSGIEEVVRQDGILSAALMQRTFSFLRANDLVWGPAIRNYMLGESPPAFDLLFWNGDGTNLPGRMAVEYLRGLCQANAFARDGFTVHGETLRLSDVTVPLCAVACETDHIAPWKDSWRGIARMGSSERRFILSQSGHIAGIINPPSKKKYGHYTSDGEFRGSPEDWQAGAQFHEGSWWQRWTDWLAERSGGQVAARDPGEGLGPAPGEYVHQRA